MQEYSHLFQILLKGDFEVGKSSIMDQFTEGKFSDNCDSTIGVEFAQKLITVPQQDFFPVTAKLQIWDIGDNNSQRKLHQTYETSDAVLLIFDLTKHSTFTNLPQWFETIERYISDTCIVFLVGTKLDLKDIRAINCAEVEDYIDIVNSTSCLQVE